MRKTFIMAIAFTAMGLASQAQERERSMGAGTARPADPRLNFSKGIEFIAPDSAFGLNLRFRMQSRALYFTESTTNLGLAEAEARVRRLRLRMEGFMYSPKIAYLVQLSFSRGDMDWDARDFSTVNTSPNIVRDAAVFYRPNRHFTFIFGQTKLPGNRQRVVSSGDQQFIDRSMVNATFNIDRDFGFQAYYQNQLGEKFTYIVKGALSTGEGRNVQATDKGLAYTGRLELLPLGEFKNRGDYFEGDLEREESPKVSLAGGMSHNSRARRTGGQIGRDLYAQRDINTYIFDALLKYRGFALYLEHMDRRSANPVTQNQQGQLRFVTTGTGSLAQTSYLFKSNYEAALRYSVIIPATEIRNLQQRDEAITAGLTRYLIKHKFKLQANISYFTKTPFAAGPSRNWGAGFQIELGI